MGGFTLQAKIVYDTSTQDNTVEGEHLDVACIFHWSDKAGIKSKNTIIAITQARIWISGTMASTSQWYAILGMRRMRCILA